MKASYPSVVGWDGICVPGTCVKFEKKPSGSLCHAIGIRFRQVDLNFDCDLHLHFSQQQVGRVWVLFVWRQRFLIAKKIFLANSSTHWNSFCFARSCGAINFHSLPSLQANKRAELSCKHGNKSGKAANYLWLNVESSTSKSVYKSVSLPAFAGLRSFNESETAWGKLDKICVSFSMMFSLRSRRRFRRICWQAKELSTFLWSIEILSKLLRISKIFCQGSRRGLESIAVDLFNFLIPQPQNSKLGQSFEVFFFLQLSS